MTSRSGIVVDSILDEFSQHAFEHELTLRPVGRRGTPRRGVAMLLAESAWAGNRGRWRHQFSHFEPGNALDTTIDRHRALGIPTVFWNKEDPAHFEAFVAVAGRFDHVLTTDANCVARYRARLGHERIATVPFAAQPALHNPIGRPSGTMRTICFAGAWRGDVHPQRIEQLTTLLDAALDVGGLRIYARKPSSGRADFPDRYQPVIVGEISYGAMVDEYRRHACFLNVNTVTDSPTMLSRRVFEILACRTPVVSAPSPAIDRFFDGVVLTPGSAVEASAVLAELVDDAGRRDRLGQLGFRLVMSSHTYQHRVSAICDMLGIDGFPTPTLPTVDGVFEVRAEVDVHRALATAVPLRACLGTVVIVCRDAGDPHASRIESRDGVTIVRTGALVTNGQILSSLPGRGDFVAFLDVEARYGTSAITDALLATRFTEADVYGKSSSHSADPAGARLIGDGREFCETTDVIDGTAIVRRGILAQAIPARRGSLSRAAIDASTRRFAVDRFNHLAPDRGTAEVGTTVHPLSEIVF